MRIYKIILKIGEADQLRAREVGSKTQSSVDQLTIGSLAYRIHHNPKQPSLHEERQQPDENVYHGAVVSQERLRLAQRSQPGLLLRMCDYGNCSQIAR